MDYPRYEKVDDYTFLVINERKEVVSLSDLLKAKENLEGQKIQIEERLQKIYTLIENAKKLGIVAEEKKEKKID